MTKKTSGHENDTMDELKKFYQRKKDEQEALKKLLKALDKENNKEKNK